MEQVVIKLRERYLSKKINEEMPHVNDVYLSGDNMDRTMFLKNANVAMRL